MASGAWKLKSGMGGSRNGKNRWTGTEILKSDSKKSRRSNDKTVIKESLKERIND